MLKTYPVGRTSAEQLKRLKEEKILIAHQFEDSREQFDRDVDRLNKRMRELRAKIAKEKRP